MNPPAELIALAKKTAGSLNLNPVLICAIVEQESAWDPWSLRYEAAFRVRYVAPQHLPPTAEIARSCSWGLMQLMGECARELGYAEQLPKLCDPETGLFWGCREFSAKLKEAQGEEAKALLLWNGGRDAAYPNQVMARQKNYVG